MSDSKNDSNVNSSGIGNAQLDVKPDEVSLLLHHNYDGIQELDHPLPRWWLQIFYATIVFSALYVGYYMVGPGLNLRQELDIALKELDLKRPKDVPIVMDEKALDPASNEKPVDHLKLGGAVFTTRCSPCHGPQGGGGIGPNLTDDFWLHGKGTANDIAKIVQVGVTEKGMPAWSAVLENSEIKDVVLYVKSLHGTNPPGAKSPQGTKL